MTKYLISADRGEEAKTIIAQTIIDTGVIIKVLQAVPGSEVLIEVKESGVDKVLNSFKKKGLIVSEIKEVVTHDPERCISCGQCVSLCPTKAFSFDEDDTLVYDESKCVLCKLCLDACPRGALKPPQN